METIKKYLGMIPVGAWVAIALVLLVMFWWFSSDIGSWWEGRKQAAFDAKEVEYQKQISDLQKQYDELIVKAREAEAREVEKSRDADLLRQVIEKNGGKAAAEQQKIDKAKETYTEDLQKIEQVKNGSINKYEFCTERCKEDAALGYPCRANYCDTFR
jgi:hypothetical protein